MVWVLEAADHVTGETSTIDPVPRVEVRWPDGLVEIFEGLAPDRYHTLQRGTGKATGGR